MTAWRMRLSQLMATYQPPMGLSWQQALSSINASPGDRQIVEELVAALERDGGFRKPVVVYSPERVIANGMHRIAAAVRFELDRIDVCDAHDDAACAPAISVSFTCRSVDDEEFDDLWPRLRSFPLADTWVDADVMSGGDHRIGGIWYCPPSMVDDLVAELRRRAADRDLELGEVDIEVLVDA